MVFRKWKNNEDWSLQRHLRMLLLLLQKKILEIEIFFTVRTGFSTSILY